jgi:hypothetical protein
MTPPPVYVLPPGPHPSVPNVHDLAADRDRLLGEVAYWRGMTDRLLLDVSRRHGSAEAARVYYGITTPGGRP